MLQKYDLLLTFLFLILDIWSLNPKLFSIAGTKDKRAVTSQKVRVLNATAEKLSSINSMTQNIRVGDFRFVVLSCDFAASSVILSLVPKIYLVPPESGIPKR